MTLCYSFMLLLALTSASLSNVEKTMFLGPPTLTMPDDSSIDQLYLISLSPKYSTARTRLNATFPDDSHPKGSETWMLLEDLTPGTRYEVRICWLATQPTEFSLYTHSLPAAFGTPDLISSLTSFAYARQATVTELELDRLMARRFRPDSDDGSIKSSFLFLQIFAAADYFSLDASLMENVPPVLVDVILDPYILNIFPKSLLPTAAYITVLAIAAWFLSGYVWQGLVYIANSHHRDTLKKKD